MTTFIDKAPMGMVIVDIDGTLSNHSKRYQKYFFDGDLEAFHSAYAEDKPTKHAQHIFRYLECTAENDMIFYVSLRYEKHMAGTIEWMAKHISRKFEHYRNGGPILKKTFIMGTKPGGENAVQARIRQVKECYQIRAAEALRLGLDHGPAVIFDDDSSNANAIARKFPNAAIFVPHK